MHTIKKYANRKLYHTNQKQYITLEGIARLVQDGETVQVLDNETGDDITASILAQVVLHANGRSGPQLSTSLLTGMIQLGGDTLANVRKTVLGSLGGGDLIESEIDRRLDALLAGGEISGEEHARWRALLLRHEFAQHAAHTHDLAARAVAMPSRSDMANLHAQVDALSASIEQLLRQK
jgi:polyhydroxyalkanoate synthesis repressor PhaR